LKIYKLQVKRFTLLRRYNRWDERQDQTKRIGADDAQSQFAALSLSFVAGKVWWF